MNCSAMSLVSANGRALNTNCEHLRMEDLTVAKLKKRFKKGDQRIEDVAAFSFQFG